MFVVSAPCYPYGIIDRIEEIAKISHQYNIWLHVDACLGGFILPWLDNIPKFDFRLEGVSSMSCDTHKYGYASKGSSVILYKNAELRKFQSQNVSVRLLGSSCRRNVEIRHTLAECSTSKPSHDKQSRGL